MREEEIIELLQRQEPKGIEELKLHYGPLIHYIIRPILSNPQEQEECFQDILMTVWEKCGQYDPSKGKWSGWLTAIARNMAINRLKKFEKARGHEVFGDYGTPFASSHSPNRDALSAEIPSEEPGPEDILLKQEQLMELKQAIHSLSSNEQALLYRKYYYRQSMEQIACELGMTKRAAEGKLYRIRKKLAKQMSM